MGVKPCVPAAEWSCRGHFLLVLAGILSARRVCCASASGALAQKWE
jgi:hypothetical protein